MGLLSGQAPDGDQPLQQDVLGLLELLLAELPPGARGRGRRAASPRPAARLGRAAPAGRARSRCPPRDDARSRPRRADRGGAARWAPPPWEPPGADREAPPRPGMLGRFRAAGP